VRLEKYDEYCKGKGLSHKEEWHNIGIISTAYGSGASLLSNFVRLLSYLAEEVHVISLNAALEGCNEARFHTINYKRERAGKTYLLKPQDILASK